MSFWVTTFLPRYDEIYKLKLVKVKEYLPKKFIPVVTSAIGKNLPYRQGSIYKFYFPRQKVKLNSRTSCMAFPSVSDNEPVISWIKHQVYISGIPIQSLLGNSWTCTVTKLMLQQSFHKYKSPPPKLKKFPMLKFIPGKFRRYHSHGSPSTRWYCKTRGSEMKTC